MKRTLKNCYFFHVGDDRIAINTKTNGDYTLNANELNITWNQNREIVKAVWKGITQIITFIPATNCKIIQ